MTGSSRKPTIRVRVGDHLFAKAMTFRGRDAWALRKLIENGERGITALDHVGPRLSHYIFKLRQAGITIETRTEAHDGPFAGHHGRYLLRSPVTILLDTGAAA